MKGFCMGCREKREIASAKNVTMKNGRPAIKGKCVACGTGMYRIVSSK